MRIVLDIEEEDIERIVKARIISTLYLGHGTVRTAGYKRPADLFRGYLKCGPGQAAKSSR